MESKGLSVERRKFMYEMALKSYSRSLKRQRLNRFTSTGLCNYFYSVFETPIFLLSELMLFGFDQDLMKCYWFTPGNLEPRIEILKQAIELCEVEIKTKRS